ncbi:D-alanyl-D-alanine carboxypeptidase family protein [Streptomyces sp. NPDC004250]|uniref:D-alanyl-D-alanine carboxypeptidase family protein n=1 Tax=Streptomyces sp. NPDC004250 TaxID=3364692 RepID=UPI00367FD658
MKDHPDGIVLVSDPWATAVSLKDYEEKPVDCCGLLRVDSRRSRPHSDRARLCVGVGVAERRGAAGMLLPLGRRRLLVEGYRPWTLQHSLFEGYAATPRALPSDADEEEIHTGTTRCSAPAGTTRHNAGAAIDLTVCAQDRTRITMNCPGAAAPEKGNGACHTTAPGLPDEVRHHRQVMRAALTAAGMVNCTTQWGHGSYRDRSWAWSPAAVYGPVERERAT